MDKQITLPDLTIDQLINKMINIISNGVREEQDFGDIWKDEANECGTEIERRIKVLEQVAIPKCKLEAWIKENQFILWDSKGDIKLLDDALSANDLKKEFNLKIDNI